MRLEFLFLSGVASGSIYTGTLNEQKTYHGYGHLQEADNKYYTGYFNNGKFEGFGLQVMDGTYFSGNWLDGAPIGKGIHSLSDGSTYIGNVEDGVYSGEGVFISEDFRYSGQWRGGKIHGRGIGEFRKNRYSTAPYTKNYVCAQY